MSGVALLIFAFWQAAAAFTADEEGIPNDITVMYNLRYREGKEKNWTLDLAMRKDYQATL